MHQIQRDLEKAVSNFTALVDSEKATAEDLVQHSRAVGALLRRFQLRGA